LDQSDIRLINNIFYNSTAVVPGEDMETDLPMILL